MSKILDENWELLSKRHEELSKDQAYIAWLHDLNQQSPLTPEEQKRWDIIVQNGQAGLSRLL